MCTAISLQKKDHYFGRNLDLEYHYKESVIVTPRNFSLPFRNEKVLSNHYAMIGIGIVVENYPLYYEATNEWGLSIAGLNFQDNAIYHSDKMGGYNLAPHELIPWILGKCKNIYEAKTLLKSTNLVKESFNDTLPLPDLHWMISDKTGDLTVEPTFEGIKVYENPFGVLTNNPPFRYHTENINNYLNLTSSEPINRFSENCPIKKYSRGMGGIGLPGDLSSASRFVRAAYSKYNSVCSNDELDAVNQFFHILGSVEQIQGCVRLADGLEKTVYTSCCNTSKGIYYYKTYENSRITEVHLSPLKDSGNQLICFPLRFQADIYTENYKENC